jgi:putative NIF3 family GTP cyclohydrolase 1 type 2
MLSLVQGNSPARTPASTMAWVAVGLVINTNATINRILSAVKIAPSVHS